jgi:predicted RNase H-like HicB family nuclease
MNDRYLVIIERASDGSYSAYLPDVPGCVSCGDTVDELKTMIQEALDFHFEGMRHAGLPIPVPTSFSEYVEVGSAT